MRKEEKLLGLAALVITVAVIMGCTPWNGAWEEKTGYYRIDPQQVGDYHDLPADWLNSAAACEVFSDLEAQYGAFICSTWNYDLLDGKRRYELSRDEAIPVEYDYYGHSMTVSRGYFDAHPVSDAQGTDVCARLTGDARTLDILVPARYRKDEQQLIKIYQEYMYFHNVEVENFYRQALGEAPSALLPGDFTINIIYVPDGTDCAVYDPWIACDRLTDCIVIVVHPANFCRAQLQALMTQGFYVYMPEEGAEKKVRAVYAAHDYTQALFGLRDVSGMYREYEQEQTRRAALIGVLALAGTVLIAGGVFLFGRKQQK